MERTAMRFETTKRKKSKTITTKPKQKPSPVRRTRK